MLSQTFLKAPGVTWSILVFLLHLFPVSGWQKPPLQQMANAFENHFPWAPPLSEAPTARTTTRTGGIDPSGRGIGPTLSLGREARSESAASSSARRRRRRAGDDSFPGVVGGYAVEERGKGKGGKAGKGKSAEHDAALPLSYLPANATPRQLKHQERENLSDAGVPLIGGGDVMPDMDIDEKPKKKSVNSTIENKRTLYDTTDESSFEKWFVPVVGCVGLGAALCLWLGLSDSLLQRLFPGYARPQRQQGQQQPSSMGAAAAHLNHTAVAGESSVRIVSLPGSVTWQAKVDIIFSLSDRDKDGVVGFSDLQWLARITNMQDGKNFDMDGFRDLCRSLSANPTRGFDVLTFRRMYQLLDGTVDSDFDGVRQAAAEDAGEPLGDEGSVGRSVECSGNPQEHSQDDGLISGEPVASVEEHSAYKATV